ncbi:chromate resistance protein ChrB domain-containing protein [Archangium sp.]|uniref:chromate resistance protein ChrB domain-containing protein n=1 Tax=Archangium sp. TaxID=1872627 RepID=UPI00389A83F5
MSENSPARWLLLLHQLPPKPAYLRVKVWRRLQRLGAVAIKHSVYALPATEEAREDFQWVAREVVESGGEATVCEARFVEGLTDSAVEALFQAARDADYSQLAEEARALLPLARDARKAPPGGTDELQSSVARLRKRLTEVVELDFFGASGREAAEGLITSLERRLEELSQGAAEGRLAEVLDKPPLGGTWVTRRGIHVDRMASAWLIRRFIDPRARFRFVDGRDYRPRKGELRFDMFEAEYTHEADLCTFEVLVQRFRLEAPALRLLAQVVHDLDLKDGKFGLAETPGIERLVAGIALAHSDDEIRLERASQLFDDLHAAFERLGGRALPAARAAPRRAKGRKP